jgi:hypothetical protein
MQWLDDLPQQSAHIRRLVDPTKLPLRPKKYVLEGRLENLLKLDLHQDVA